MLFGGKSQTYIQPVFGGDRIYQCIKHYWFPWWLRIMSGRHQRSRTHVIFTTSPLRSRHLLIYLPRKSIIRAVQLTCWAPANEVLTTRSRKAAVLNINARWWMAVAETRHSEAQLLRRYRAAFRLGNGNAHDFHKGAYEKGCRALKLCAT